MTDALVNSIYPVSYFSLPGVDTINYPDTFWWSSKERYASIDTDGVTYKPVVDGGTPTAEILEIDLGRVREINYINFDVLRAPISIKIEYDALSSPDRDSVWLPVTPITGQDFDKDVTFDPNNRTSWLNAEFNFTDSKGNMVHTRYLRITFTRQDVAWPTNGTGAFQWPVFVKQLRIGRNVTTLLDTVGPLLTQDTPLNIVATPLEITGDNLTSHEARQQFVISPSAIRAGATPNMLGFGVLIQTETVSVENDQSAIPGEVEFGWSIWDVTNSAAPVKIINGVESVAVTQGLSWLDWYLRGSTKIAGDTTKIYELRVFSMNAAASKTVFTHSPNILSNTPIPGTLTFTNGSSAVATSVDTTATVKQGDLIVRADIPDQVYLVNAVNATTITINIAYPGATASGVTGSIVYPFSTYDDGTLSYLGDGTKNLVMRVWSDTGDEGRDILGNSYRYLTRQQTAASVLDANAAGWMSEPQPSPDAVEALYFDVRSIDPNTADYISTVIEAIQIAPRTPGVRMNVYYTLQGLHGDRPVTTDDWDYLLWTPIHETYTLRRNEVIQLPHAFRAAFIKLEFSSLNPLPYKFSQYPPPPPKLFRRFPTWVEDQFNNAQIRNLVSDWFLRTATPVQTNILNSLRDPVLEFQYEQQQFLAALALGKITDSQIVNSSIVDVADKAIIDPTTASKIYVSFDNQYKNTLLLSVDQSSILGHFVAQRFDSTTITDPNEAVAPSVVDGSVPFVSTTNNRIEESYQNLAQTPMRFNKISRHVYTIDQGEFNKKAFFVGIDKVRFLRNNYTIKHDDPVIPDNLYDDVMLTSNTFTTETGTSIPDGAVLYVSYSVNPDIVDEQILLVGNAPVQLAQTGGPAFNVFVYDQPNKQGVQYFQDVDYELSYGLDELGNRATFIQRSSLGQRLVVPEQPIVYVDAGTVVGHSVIPSPPTDDAAVVVGVGVPSASGEGPPAPDYATGHYGTGTYGSLFGAIPTDDAATVIGHAVISGAESFEMVDAFTVVGVAVVSTTFESGP